MDRRVDVARITRILRSLNADLVGLQEVAPGGQLERLAAAGDYLALAGPTLLRADCPGGVALLSRHPVGAVRHHDFSVYGYEPRGALDVETELGGCSARVVVTHFGLHAAERKRQTRRLLEALGDTEHELVIVMGDINEWWSRRPLLRALDQRFGQRRTPRTFPSWLPLLALDRIWIKGDAEVRLQAVAARPARVASDHLPLLARFTVPGLL